MLYIAIGFFVPVLTYVAFYWRRNHKDFPGHTFILAAALALLPLITVLAMVFSSPYWSDGTRVVWTGFTVGSGKPLIVGGPREQAVVGWPNGSFAPSLKAVSEGGNNGTIEIEGGEAFVYDEKNEKYLNGKIIPLGQSEKYGDYTIRVSRSWPFFWLQDVEILGKDDRTLASVSLRRYSVDRDRVRSLRFLIENNTARDLADLERVTEMDNLKEWAAGVHLLLTRGGDIYILDEASTGPIKCAFPARLSLLWTNLRLPVDLWYQNGQLVLTFESPWRLSCPLPPGESGKDIPLTVTNSVQPGDNVFMLPLGHEPEVTSLRKTLMITADSPRLFVDGVKESDRQGTPGWINIKPSGRPNRIGTSQISIESGSYSFGFATVNDLPDIIKVVLLSSLAYLCFLCGLYLSFPRMPAINRWVVHGLGLFIWSFLAFRLLLAFRYILDPNSIDSLSIKGVTQAFVALAVVPGLILLLARLRCDWYECPAEKKEKLKAIIYALSYLCLLLVALLIEFYGVPHLWGDIPERYHSSMGFLYLLFLLAIFVYLAGYVRFLYQPDPRKFMVKLFVTPWGLAESYLEKRRKQLGKVREEKGTVPLPPKMHYVRLYVGFLLYFTIFPFLLHLITGDKAIQEIVIPVLFYWIPAFLWISWLLYFAPSAHGQKANKKLLIMVLFAIPTICFPVIFVPFVIGDVGSVLAILAVFLPLACLLLAAPRDNLQAGLAVTLTLAVVFLVGGFFYQNLDLLPFQTAKVRLLNFKEGPLIQRYVLWSNAAKGSASEGLPYQELLNGYQHSWENKAIAHEGGATGLGFGNAPTRRSHIRQDTIQYDSAYSFFVVSEYGLAGALLLLLIYAAPLVIILLAGRVRFDAGYGLAALLASSFLIEALFHAGMNLGAFPMTGRGLPLLTVNSLSELLRWTVAFAAVVQLVFWRYKGDGEIKREATSLINPSPDTMSLSAGASAAGGAPQAAFVRRSPGEERFSLYAKAIAVILIIPFLMSTAVAYNGSNVLFDSENELSEFGYSYILKNIDHLIDINVITLDPKTLEISIDKSRLEVTSDNQLIQQQAARFNALDIGEKVEETKLNNLRLLQERLVKARTVDDYQRILEQLKDQSFFGRDRRKLTLFRLEPISKEEDEERDDNATEYRLIANPDFNVSLSFAVNQGKENMPVVKMSAAGKPGQEVSLIGPAWMMGRWVAATNMDVPLPWLVYLREALQKEWKSLGPEMASAHYGTLTLDPKLHLDAMEFMAKKGNELHQEVLNVHTNSRNYLKKLPPRVALSIVSLPRGETLALGGWPYMSSDSFWKRKAEAGWVPPVEWINREAPRCVRVRYGGERNFDRTLLMGSSTKPLWATAVLAVHPNLDKQLKVRGPGGEENDVFGININPGWDVQGSDIWVDFKKYLASSDNRYHIRLGFLGLAETAGGDVVGVGSSNSIKESLGSPSGEPWRKSPQFPVKIGFSDNNPNVLLNLHDTELARYLKSMYSIGIGKNDFAGRISFWTKNEADDLQRNSSVSGKGGNQIFRWISPEASEFSFDHFSGDYKARKGPRDFVTILLGGGSNLWSNVDFAAAFGTCITGHPVVAHIVKNQDTVTPLKGRMMFPDIAAKVRPGLAAVITEGTAFRTLQKSAVGKNALALLKAYPKAEIYAKTGTLKSEEGSRNTSRIVLAIVKWKDKNKGLVESGLVFSVVAERAQVGKATEWLAEFLVKYRADIEKFL